MKIGSHIRPKTTAVRNQSLFGINYPFTKQPDGQFLAEVTDELHIQTFLANPSFYAAEAGATLTRATPSAPASESVQVLADGTVVDPDAALAAAAAAEAAADAAVKVAIAAFPSEVQADAKKLLSHPVQKLAVAMGKLEPLTAVDVLRCAKLIEEGAKDPRSTAVKLIDDCLAAMAAAKVKG